jgi:hypothetical protein
VPVHPVLLKAAAVGLWAAAMGMSFTAADWRLWACLVAGAAVASLAALQQILVTKSTRIYEAQTRAVLTRPFHRGDTGPLPAIIPQQPAPGSEPHARLSVLGRSHGQHASR